MFRKMLSGAQRFVRGHVVRLGALRRLSTRYCIENRLLPSLITRTPSANVREMLGLPASEYCPQLNQDIFALLMNQFRPGVFLEIGANDGFTVSNTVYLEEEFGWSGILVEANPKYLATLARRRRSAVVNKAVASQAGKAEFLDAGLHGGLKDRIDDAHRVHRKDAPTITVDCAGLQEILDDVDAPARIDFVSIDVEGGEVPIVEQMVSGARRFRCGCIERNQRAADYQRIVTLLTESGYNVVWEGQTGHDLFFVDTHVSEGAPLNVVGSP